MDVIIVASIEDGLIRLISLPPSLAFFFQLQREKETNRFDVWFDVGGEEKETRERARRKINIVQDIVEQ